MIPDDAAVDLSEVEWLDVCELGERGSRCAAELLPEEFRAFDKRAVVQAKLADVGFDVDALSALLEFLSSFAGR